MNPLAVLWRKQTDVFHLRMGGCSGCAEMVDMVLRDGRWPGGSHECSSPRHAALLIVTGLWTPGLADSALAVVSQAPVTRRVLAAGDCALGRGIIAGCGRPGHRATAPLEPDLEITGCPVEAAAVSEAVRRVSR